MNPETALLQAKADFDRLIETGGDPNALDIKGHTLISRISQAQLLPDWVGVAIEALMERGAHLSEADFRNLLKMAPRVGGATALAKIVARWLLNPEATPIHQLARGAPGLLNQYLNDASSETRDSVVMREWMRRQDGQGQTPSHALWGPHTLLVEHAEQARCADHSNQMILVQHWKGTARVCWQTQQEMLDAGAGLGDPDHEGRTALDLCIERVGDGTAHLAPELPACRRVMAEIQRRKFEMATPAVSVERRAGARL